MSAQVRLEPVAYCAACADGTDWPKVRLTFLDPDLQVTVSPRTEIEVNE